MPLWLVAVIVVIVWHCATLRARQEKPEKSLLGMLSDAMAIQPRPEPIDNIGFGVTGGAPGCGCK